MRALSLLAVMAILFVPVTNAQTTPDPTSVGIELCVDFPEFTQSHDRLNAAQQAAIPACAAEIIDALQVEPNFNAEVRIIGLVNEAEFRNMDQHQSTQAQYDLSSRRGVAISDALRLTRVPQHWLKTEGSVGRRGLGIQIVLLPTAATVMEFNELSDRVEALADSIVANSTAIADLDERKVDKGPLWANALMSLLLLMGLLALIVAIVTFRRFDAMRADVEENRTVITEHHENQELLEEDLPWYEEPPEHSGDGQAGTEPSIE